MKKTYQNPTMTIVKIQTMQMLANSNVGVGSTYNGETVLSREDSFWDDEE